MRVSLFASWVNVHAKHFHACDNSEIATEIEVELGQARIYVNNSSLSKKSRKQLTQANTQKVAKMQHKAWEVSLLENS